MRYDLIFTFICIHSVKQALVHYFVLQLFLAQCLSFFLFIAFYAHRSLGHFGRLGFAWFLSLRFSPALGPFDASQDMPAGKPPGHYLGGSRSDPVSGDWALSLANFTPHSFATSMVLFLLRWFGLYWSLVACSFGLVSFLGFTFCVVPCCTVLCCVGLGCVGLFSSRRCRQRACGSQWMPHPQTTSLHDRRGLVFDPRWPAVVLQLATLSGRLCELLSIASTVVTATKTSPRRTSRWKLLFLQFLQQFRSRAGPRVGVTHVQMGARPAWLFYCWKFF